MLHPPLSCNFREKKEEKVPLYIKYSPPFAPLFFLFFSPSIIPYSLSLIISHVLPLFLHTHSCLSLFLSPPPTTPPPPSLSLSPISFLSSYTHPPASLSAALSPPLPLPLSLSL